MAGKGSPKGVKQGGRAKGTPNKKNQEIVEKALSVGITPLEVMLMAMKDALDKGELKEASNFAKDAAPYCHAKLQSTVVKNAEGETFRTSAAMLPPSLIKAIDDAITSKY
jgi:hypothetical protein